MAHFAELDETGVVLRVLVVPDDQEHRGEAFLRDDLGLGGRWVQTSYNGRIRRRYAGVGMTYDPARDSFIPRQPYPSWTLNDNFGWEAPEPMPDDGNVYEWNEDRQRWVRVQ